MGYATTRESEFMSIFVTAMFSISGIFPFYFCTLTPVKLITHTNKYTKISQTQTNRTDKLYAVSKHPAPATPKHKCNPTHRIPAGSDTSTPIYIRSNMHSATTHRFPLPRTNEKGENAITPTPL
ncbi:hypothetical protein ASPFODRAFT_321443 [Aspergillus luchuensis CBS 106.47]|uniref:Uncharacterized protein n=1 Tax=Aspergillus luchuensis (strain CBS 106.47) TaxID=1137211 RepID=A0A1M3T9R7_ASPLC|nr:hypothetical protein ASPFODRAFT_321443 [Aspergillus luchuensis CBS 106.47]